MRRLVITAATVLALAGPACTAPAHASPVGWAAVDRVISAVKDWYRSEKQRAYQRRHRNQQIPRNWERGAMHEAGLVSDGSGGFTHGGRNSADWRGDR